MLIYIYAISFIVSLSGLIGWFYAQEQAKQTKAFSTIFLGGFFAYLFSLAFAEVAFEHKLWVLCRDLIVLGLTSQFFSFFKKNKTIFFGLLAILYGFIGAKYFSVLTSSFDVEPKTETVENIENALTDVGLADNGELLVEVKDDKQIADLQSIIKQYNLKYAIAFPQIKNTDITDLDDYYLINIPDEWESKRAVIVRALNESGLVDWVENNEVLNVSPMRSNPISINRPNYGVNDPGLGNVWGFDKMQMSKLYQTIKTKKLKPKKKTLVVILDTGVDADHEDINGNYKKIRAKYGVDKHGHGTHCAGIAAAVSNNKIGIASFAPNNGFYEVSSVQVLASNGSGTQQGIIKGIIEAADNGGDILSLSLGGRSTDSKQRAYKKAVDYARSKGCIVVVAAGNSNMNAKFYAPANTPGVITVSAVDEALNKAVFSNTVQDVSMGIAAPGVNVYSTIPNNGYDAWNGTSMATPYVAGLLGLMKSLNPDLTTEQAYKILKSTGVDSGNTELTGKFIQPQKALEVILK
ncbi:MAG: S8 family serine peptidase [Saprospiraceae bacterium]